jgi:N-acetylmuramoyl-L-alanine amidase
MKQNRLILAFTLGIFAILLASPNVLSAQGQVKPLKRIVIDPGHGGTDSGATGEYSTEAAISLAISLKLADYIKNSLPELEVVLTRKTDVFNSVVEKAKIANAAKGDLFICIHTNSADPTRKKEIIGYTSKTKYVKKNGKKRKVTVQVPKYKVSYTPSQAKGTETFIYNVDKSSQRKEMANDAVDDVVEKLDSVSEKQIQEINETDPTRSMMASLVAQQYFQRAASLALTIEEEFKNAGRLSRDAKQRQKGIWVLAAVQMPAVLVETGFISNPDDENYLNSEEGQNQICEVITKSLIRYKNSLENQKKSNAN